MSGPSSFWLGDTPLILASGSAIRATLLRNAGLPVEVISPQIDERAVEQPLLARGAKPHEIAAALAKAKARAISLQHPDRWVLGADQTLECNGTMFHKPTDAEAAKQQLAKLSGHQHRLTSAAALMRNGELVAAAINYADLTMRALNAKIIADYVSQAGAAVLTSVGAYQLEGLGIHLFEKIEGDHFTILGLPLLQILAEMRKIGAISA